MPYKDKEKATGASKLRMQKMRQGVTNQGVTDAGVTLDVTQYPAILLALTDPVKRRKLEKITESLKSHNQLKNVYYGYPDKGVPFDVVGELLEATR